MFKGTFFIDLTSLYICLRSLIISPFFWQTQHNIHMRESEPQHQNHQHYSSPKHLLLLSEILFTHIFFSLYLRSLLLFLLLQALTLPFSSSTLPASCSSLKSFFVYLSGLHIFILPPFILWYFFSLSFFVRSILISRRCLFGNFGWFFCVQRKIT